MQSSVKKLRKTGIFFQYWEFPFPLTSKSFMVILSFLPFILSVGGRCHSPCRSSPSPVPWSPQPLLNCMSNLSSASSCPLLYNMFRCLQLHQIPSLLALANSTIAATHISCDFCLLTIFSLLSP